MTSLPRKGRGPAVALAPARGLPMKAVVVVNALAGSVPPGETTAFTARISEAMARAGIVGEVRAVPREELCAAVEEAARSPADAVVVGGGDGTLSAALPTLLATGKPLGVLPLGTLNHFAKDLGLPLDLDEAMRMLALGHLREVDVGEINGRLFLNNCSLGLYPEVVRDRESREQRDGRARWPAMIRAAWATLRRFPVVRVSLHANGRAWTLITPLVFVGNNRYETRLLALANRPQLDGGDLWVYMARRTGRLGIVRLGLRAVLGRLDQADDFESLATGVLEIRARQPRLRVAVDGEVEQFEAPLRCRIRPRALKVLAPPAAA